MRRFWPRLLIATGLFLFVGGFIYDLLFAGIPYQDPTPEMLARYNRHARIASTIQLSGISIFLTGVFAGIIRWVVQRFQ